MMNLFCLLTFCLFNMPLKEFMNKCIQHLLVLPEIHWASNFQYQADKAALQSQTVSWGLNVE